MRITMYIQNRGVVRINYLVYVLIYLLSSMISFLIRLFTYDITGTLMFTCLAALFFLMFRDILNAHLGHNFTLLIFVNLIIRMVFVIVDEYIVNFASPFNADSAGYKLAAEAIVTGNENEYQNFITYFAANVVYRFWGVSPGFLRFLICFMAMLSVLILLQICDEARISRRITKKMLVIFLFLPENIIINSSFLREGFITVAVIGGLAYLQRWFKCQKMNDIFYAGLLFLFATLCHSGMIVSLLVAMFCYITYSNGKYHFTEATLFRLLFAFGIAIVGIYFMRDALFAKFGGGMTYPDLLNRVEFLESEGGNSLYIININFGFALLNFIVNSAVRALYLYLSPMVWDIRNVSAAIMFIMDSVFYILAFILIFKKRKNILKNQKPFLVAVLLMATLGGIVFGWGTVTAGTAMRHRLGFLPIILFMAATVFDDKKQVEENFSEQEDFSQLLGQVWSRPAEHI